MLKVYNYMTIGLGITGLIAYFVASNPALIKMFFGGAQAYIVMLAPLAFVFYFSAKVHSMAEKTAQICFFSYSALMGLSLAVIFFAYTGVSVARALFVTASLFGALSLYGYTTKKDLTSFGSFLFMGLIGIILASLVNIFLGSTAIYFIISAASVIIFTGLTAYDTQKIKQLYYITNGNEKAAIMGALSLYLDFINLFITMLRFMGDRK